MLPVPTKWKRSLAFVALLGACGGRVDTPPPPPPPSDFADCESVSGVGKVTPQISCVGSIDGRSYALLGYTSGADGVVNVPLGSSNTLVDSTPVAWDGRGSPTPPTAFLPGSHLAAVAVPYGGALTWTLGTTTVNTSGAPACVVSGSGPLAGIGVATPSGFVDGVRLAPLDPASSESSVEPDGPLNGAAVGVTASELSVSPTGAATYQIPIPIPVGRQGMQPNVSLDYNSQSGNGLAGVGWNLHAASVIAACEQSVHAAGATGSCLDGEPLFRDPGDAEVVLRPEHSPLVRITRGENRYVAHHPNGHRQFFERVSIAPNIYPLIATIDSSGNSIRYQYTNPGGDPKQLEISAIHYTYDSALVARRHVYFDYEVRPDHESTKARPAPRRSRRLTKIRSTVETSSGEESFREIRLTYTLSASSGRSLLASVTECEGHGVCRRPLTFTYSDGRPLGPEFKYEGKNVGNPNANVPTAPFVPAPSTDVLTAKDQPRYNLIWGDFDGDGRLDALAYNAKGLIGVTVDPLWCLMRGQPDGSMSACTADSGVPTNLVYGENRGPSPVPVDWDLDGRMDLAVPVPKPNDGGEGKVWSYRIYRADDAGKFAPTVDTGWDGWITKWEPLIIGDFAGDAYPESKNGKDFQHPHLVANQGYKQVFFKTTKHPNTIVDVNADGYFEVLEDTLLDKPVGDPPAFEQFHLFDPDHCGPPGGTYPDPNSCSGGESFDKPSTISSQIFWPGKAPPRLPLRRLGNGRIDLLFWASTSSDTATLNQLLRFEPDGKSANPKFLPGPSGLPHVRALASDDLKRFAWATVGDVDGDGFDDVILPVLSPSQTFPEGLALRIFRNQADVQSDLLAGIDNGLGDRSSVHYSVFKEKVPEPALQDADCKMPVGCYARDLWVADGYALHTQAGGPKRSFSLTYAKPRTDLDGGGFLGFKSVAARDEQTGATNTTTFGKMSVRQNGVYLYAKSPTQLVTRVPLSSSPIRYQEETTDLDYTYVAKGGAVAALNKAIHSVAIERRAGVEEKLSDQTESFGDFDEYGNPAFHEIYAALAGVRVTTRTTHRNLVGRWILGLPERIETTSDAGAVDLLLPGKGKGTRVIVNDFDESGLLLKTTREPDGTPELKLVVDYQRNGYGQPTRIRATDSTGKQRVSQFVYDAVESNFVVASIDSLGHRRTFAYNHLLGLPTSSASANGVVQKVRYDGFGDAVWSSSPKCTHAPCPALDAETTIRRLPGKEPKEAFMVVSTTSGRPSTEVAVDALLRTVRAEVTAFDGTMAPSWINYDPIHIGSPSSVVRIPSLTSSSLTDIVFSSTTLDTLGRPVEVRTPQGGTTRIQYVGRRETVTGPTGNTRSFTRDELGRVVRSTTFLGVSTTPPIPGLPGGTTIEQTITDYVYGAFGDLVHLQDQAGNASDFTYDRIGRRILSADPDFGLTRKDYDAFGNVQRMTDAEGRVTTVAVDALGRIVATRSPDGLSCFSWDGSPSSIGQLAADRFVPAIAGEPTVSHGFEYDGFGRPIRTSQFLDGAALATETTYDANGRTDSLRYPNGFTARYGYTAAGHLATLTDGGGKLIWREGKQNLLGQTEFEGYGDGYVTSHTYESATRLPHETITYRIFQTGELEHFEYKWNADGALRAQRDLADPDRANFETYQYDRAERLERWSGKDFDVSFSYDLTGNLLKRAATSAATGITKATTFTPRPAGGAQPHGLQSSSDGSYSYDKTGNQVAAPDQKAEWTAFHLPRKVTTGSTSTQYAYDAGGQRVLEIQGAARVRRVGGLYEERTSETGAVTKVVSVSNGKGTVAQFTEGEVNSVRYFHLDHLGSVHVVTDESGAFIDRRRYEPFGRQVESKDPTTPKADGPSVGFTGHDHDATHGLVNMRGRIYDPRTGRFLSPDPVIADPLSGQDLNRFSYVGNDPMNHTDPTGFCRDELGCGPDTPPIGGGDPPEPHWGQPPPDMGKDPNISFGSKGSPAGGVPARKEAPSLPAKAAPTAANSGSSFGPSPKLGAWLLPGGQPTPAPATNALDPFSCDSGLNLACGPGTLFGQHLQFKQLTADFDQLMEDIWFGVDATSSFFMVGGIIKKGLLGARAAVAFIRAGGIDKVIRWVALRGPIPGMGTGGLGLSGLKGLKRLPTMTIDYLTHPELAENIAHAQKAGHSRILTYNGGGAVRNANRAAAIGDVRRAGAKFPGLTLDEYPFASTVEGGAGSWVGHVPKWQQDAQGGIIGGFIKANRLQAGDRFIVVVINLVL